MGGMKRERHINDYLVEYQLQLITDMGLEGCSYEHVVLLSFVG
jgi:hypothetical protein